MLAVLARNRNLRRLWGGEVISLLGDWLTYVAISVLALKQGEGLMAVALVLVAHTLPNAVMSPLAGFIIDRVDRRTVLVVASAARGAITFGMAAAAAAGNLWLAQALLVLRTAVSALHEPAAQAALARIVEPKDLLAANSLLAATWSTVFTIGVAAGGFLAAAVGPATAMVLDAVTFLAAAAVLRTLPSIVAHRSDRREKPRFVRELSQAWRYASARPHLARHVLGKMPMGIATGGSWVLLNHVADTATWIASTAATLGALHAVRAIGTGVGPILWMRALGNAAATLPYELTTLAGLAGIALFIASPHPAWALFGILVWGVGSGANWVVTSTRIQRDTPDEYRGRLSSIDMFGIALGICAGAWSSAWVGERSSAEHGAAALAATALALTIVVRARFSRARLAAKPT